jgi:branched-chain amino acid transport system ATP-binding protein
VEHDMGPVMRICTQINVLDFGAVLMVGSPDQVRADERVRAAYLGAADDPEVPVSADDELATTMAAAHG